MVKKENKSAKSSERCATGISGFDKLCEGGLLSESINLVVGGPGTGKTTFMLQFLFNGAKEGEPGLYISFEQPIDELLATAKKLGMDFDPLIKSGKVNFTRIDGELSVKELETRLKSLISKNKAKRVCLDTLNVFVVDLPKTVNTRKEIYEAFRVLKALGTCILFSGEADEQGLDQQTLSEEIHFAKYFVDGVIELYSSGLGGVGDRALRIAKMRMTNHLRGPAPTELNDKGLRVV